MTKAITIAIDGFSSCGKSTLAKDLAQELGFLYIDSGAMYRAVSLYFIENSIPLDDTKRILNALDSIHIEFKQIEDKQYTFLNNKDVTLDIRSKEVNSIVSPVAKISEVRKFLVAKQRSYRTQNIGIVMDGRDIGSVVFPQAELKLFVTAGIEIRVQRRFIENQSKGIEASFENVKENLLTRDHIDSTREDSPLLQTSDAIVIDNSQLSRKEQLHLALEYVDSVNNSVNS